MQAMTIKEIEKECRLLAKQIGATFKEHTRLRINNRKAYYFINRSTGDVLLENCTLGSAYDNLLSGHVGDMMA
jgi:hypothetical protein